jgi:hypothetical protein
VPSAPTRTSTSAASATSADTPSFDLSPFKTDSSSFTTVGTTGFYWCDKPTLAVHCNDGHTEKLSRFGQDITGRLSGTELSETWGADLVRPPYPSTVVEISAEFTGRKR